MSNLKRAMETRNISKFDKEHPYMKGYLFAASRLIGQYESNSHRALGRVTVEVSDENHQ